MLSLNRIPFALSSVWICFFIHCSKSLLLESHEFKHPKLLENITYLEARCCIILPIIVLIQTYVYSCYSCPCAFF